MSDSRKKHFYRGLLSRWQGWSLLVIILSGAQVALVLGSWLWSAANPESSIRAILSDGGIRWFFGSFVANLSSPLLAWILLLDIGAGACVYSGLWKAVSSVVCRSGCPKTAEATRYRSGIIAASVAVVVEAVVILLLVLPRNAILLSATGHLFPSSFSVSLIPIVAFMLLTAAIAYGLFCGIFHSYSDVVRCVLHGGNNLKVVLAVYILAMELWQMAVYVWN